MTVLSEKVYSSVKFFFLLSCCLRSPAVIALYVYILKKMGHSSAKPHSCLADLAKPSLLKHND